MVLFNFQHFKVDEFHSVHGPFSMTLTIRNIFVKIAEEKRIRSGKEQGRIHGNPVADGWAGAVMRKPLANQKSDRPTDRPTDLPTDTASFRVACPRLKTNRKQGRVGHRCVLFESMFFNE